MLSYFVSSNSSSLCCLSNQWFSCWPSCIHNREVCNVEWLQFDKWYCNVFGILLYKGWTDNQCDDLLDGTFNCFINEALLWSYARTWTWFCVKVKILFSFNELTLDLFNWEFYVFFWDREWFSGNLCAFSLQHLMTGPKGNSELNCFPETLKVPWGRVVCP